VAPLAILYDVHGNLPALEAVLGDVRGTGADRFLLGGDYALFGPCPAETVAALRGLAGATWIRGNVDRWTAHPDQAPEDEFVPAAIAACRDALGADTVAELDTLPEQLVSEGTRFCHASPISDLRSFLPAPADDEDELLEGVGERRVVFGHTHLQFRRVRPDGIELVNPGSVGMPMDGDTRAAYALLYEDDAIELRRVGYDHEAVAAAMLERFAQEPWVTRSVARLRTARP
jgi:diadenosine tetraphosphatase ApaH/serine/threonine PP2A family protein phosphatase